MVAADNLEAGAGEARAQFEQGAALLRSDEVGKNLQRGVALVEAASAAGCAEASEMAAVFEAMGVDRPQSWDRALDLLQLAAEQGSKSAQAQLLVIADDPSDDSWAAIRSRISIEDRLRHGDREALCDRPRIRAIERFATRAECNWIVERARSRLKPALIYDHSGRQVLDPGRSNTGTDFPVPEMDLVLELVRTRISAAANIPLPVFELTQVLHYSVGQEFRPHLDYLDLDNAAHLAQLRAHGQRIATFLIFLNEGFEGGETAFPSVGVRYRGKPGDAIFWANVDMEGRPEPLSLHAGLPPTAGEKWILSQWIRDRSGPQQ